MGETFDPIVTPVDFVVFGGMATPGVARVVGLTKPKRLDELSGPGLSGAFIAFRGVKLARFTVEIDLYEPQHFTDWDLFLRFVREPKIPSPMRNMAFDVWHPVLAQRQIASAVIEDIKGPDQQGTDSLFRVSIPCIEYRTPRIQSSKPDQPEERKRDEFDRQLDEKKAVLARKSASSNWGGWWE